MKELNEQDRKRIEQEAIIRYTHRLQKRRVFIEAATYEHNYQREQQAQQEIINNNIIEQLQIRVEQDIAKIKKLEDDAHEYSAWQSEYRASRAEVERLKAERSELRNKVVELEKLIASDSVYTLLRFGDKNPSYSGVDECEEERLYQNLYNISRELRNSLKK